MTKFEEEFNYLIELSGKVLIGQVDAEAFEKNRIAFFEKYETDQQQDLPVVPECVAKTVELLKKNPESSWSKLHNSLGEEGVDWLNEFQHKDERFGFGELNSKLIVLFHLAINGYQVEKPQLFYLKNKLTGLNLVLEQSFNATGKHVGERFREFDMQYIATDEQEARLYKNTFSKAEIKNMDAGSYEQIEVAE